MTTAERARLASMDGLTDPIRQGPWRRWGPYLSERAWGTVREDYSEHGTAWDYFPHDHARSRAYRWNEDGMAGICDDRQTFCFALALWNGEDPILKERMFGLGGDERQPRRGRQGVLVVPGLHADPLLDALALPLPAGRLPVRRPGRGQRAARPRRARVRAGRHRRLRRRPVLGGDGRLRQGVARPTCACAITVANRGARGGDRCTCCPRCGSATPGRGACRARPRPAASAARRAPAGRPSTRTLGQLVLARATAAPAAAALRQRDQRRPAVGPARPLAVPEGRHQRPRRARRATRSTRPASAPRARCTTCSTCRPGETREIRLRLAQTAPPPARRAARGPALDLGAGFDAVHGRARARGRRVLRRADPGRRARPTRRWSLRQAIAGLMWGKQFYHFDVARWLDGDPASAPPPAGRRTGATAHWWHMTSFDVISMPDPWEYPWYAAWDLAFHCVSHRPGRPRLRQGPAAPAAAASGTCTPTARSRRTSGRSAT